MQFLAMAVAIAAGVLCGLGSFTFGYGNGAAYFRNDPAACTNCHIMQEQYDSWLKSGHAHVATCNDCHLPHHPVGKWATKADNGFFHSLAFTTNDFHEPIRIKDRNRRVTEQACLYCHAEMANALLPTHHGEGVVSCMHCHLEVGHH